MGNSCCQEGGTAVEAEPEPVKEPPKELESMETAAPDDNPLDFTITLKKKGGNSDKLGADVARAPNHLVLLKIADTGLLADHNKSNPSNPVKINDQVMSVNGVSGDSMKILEEITAKKVLTLQVTRDSA